MTEDVREDALIEAYWKLCDHAAGYRASKLFRATQERRDADRTDQRAYAKHVIHEFYARGIEAAARTIARDLIGVPEHDLVRPERVGGQTA